MTIFKTYWKIVKKNIGIRFFYMKIEKIDMKRYKNKWMMLIGCYSGTIKTRYYNS